MRKGLICLLLSTAAAASLLPGCAGGRNGGHAEEKDSLKSYTCDTAFYGHLGEGTAMSSLELVTDDGDTLVLSKTKEETGDLGRILGEIANYTDRYAITTCDDGRSVCVALNIDQLAQRKWQSETDGQEGFLLETGGKVRPLSDAGSNKYGQWSLCNCKLVLTRKSEGLQGAETENDTLDILKLTSDSLVLRNSRKNISHKFHRLTEAPAS